MKDLLDQFFETYESNITDYNDSIEKFDEYNNAIEKACPNIDAIIKNYLSTKDSAKLASELVDNLGIDFISKQEFTDIPKEIDQAKAFMKEKIDDIHPAMLGILNDIANNKSIRIIRFIWVDDFRDANFIKPGCFWTAYKYKDDSWYEEYIVDNAESNYMELIATVPGSACSLGATLTYAMEYTTSSNEMREYEVHIKDQSKIKIYSARLKDGYEYIV